MGEQEFNVDEAMERLEAINKSLAAKNIGLKESIELYKEGAELASKCKESLTGIEKQLKVINEENQ